VKLLQKFAAAVEQLTHWALVGLSKDFIQREAVFLFFNGVKNWEVK
jgi:hypothetical protein